jgi:hypothetical protein
MRLNEVDVARLITACNMYKEKTGSEYMWDEYTELVKKLERLCEQGYCSVTNN